MLKTADIAGMIDHALLRPDITKQQVADGCAIARQCGCAAVCVRPCDVHTAIQELEGSDVNVGSVVGFPHGGNPTGVKVLEAEMCIAYGCRELDMVLNIGRMKSGEYDQVEHDIRAVCDFAHNKDVIVKVIFENAYLTDDEIAMAAQISERSGADYIKTATGFAAHGALLKDLRIMRANCSERVKIKAAGGIRTLNDVLTALGAGCSRIGASATQAIVAEAMKAEQEGTLCIPKELTGLKLTSQY